MSVGFIGAGQLAFALAKGFTAAGSRLLGCRGWGVLTWSALSPLGNGSGHVFGVLL